MWVCTVPSGLLVQLGLQPVAVGEAWHAWAAGHKEGIPGPVLVEVRVSGAVGLALGLQS